MPDKQIPSDDDGTNREVLAKQADMFRLAERDYGLTLAALSSETGIPLSTLKGYAHSNPFARAKMDIINFHRLCRVIPDDLTSLMLPIGKSVTSDEPGDGDEAALACDSAEYNVEYLHATNKDSEGGPAITPSERAKLADIQRRMKGRRVAA